MTELEHTIEATATELVRAEPVQPAPPTAALSVVPELNADDLVHRLNVIREAAEKAMQENVDFGRIPGTDKPTLYKPGAEKLSALFQLDVQITHDERWGPGDHLTVTAHAGVFSALSGARLGSGEGLCSTRERKYGKRRQERVCPHCAAPAVIKGKAEYGGGWLCWKKRDGCGATWPDGTREIEDQEVGEVENPDLPDSWNTVVKMARKRALVDAVLLVTGASAIFTQDLEDQPQAAAQTVSPSPPPAEPEYVTQADIEFLQKAAKGLTAEQIKLAMGSVGVPIPDPFVWNRVPKEKGPALLQALGAVER